MSKQITIERNRLIQRMARKEYKSKGTQCFQEQGNGRHTAYYQSAFRVYEKSRKPKGMADRRACRKDCQANLCTVRFRFRTDADSKKASF